MYLVFPCPCIQSECLRVLNKNQDIGALLLLLLCTIQVHMCIIKYVVHYQCTIFTYVFLIFMKSSVLPIHMLKMYQKYLDCLFSLKCNIVLLFISFFLNTLF